MVRTRPGPPRVQRRISHWLAPLLALCICAVLFVGSDLIEHHVFPVMSTGLHHFLLTMRAAFVTLVGCTIVFLVMRQQQQALSATADQLACLLGSYKADKPSPGRFENPHLRHCRQVVKCGRSDCPMYVAAGERCWHVMALRRTAGTHASPQVELRRCLDCDVYRLSCPDTLTELGESFNNLMFLLEHEAAQVRRMRTQMDERERMAVIGQIASGIAHEVGNPLSSISSVVQMLKRRGAAAPMSDQLDLIETHIQRISTIVRQLADLARRDVERWEEVDLRQTLQEALRLVGFDQRARNVDIVLDLPESLPRTYGLRGKLDQVFINLALNALDAMPGGGTLTISARKENENIIVRVKDTGCGIPPEVGRRILEPFFTSKEPGQGTGLGLAVSYGIIQKHGGTIDFESTVGQGTEFIVQIPLLHKAPEASHVTSNRTSSR